MREAQLQALAAVARDGSLAKAGRALGRSPTTVGRQLAALETEVGVALVRCGPDGVSLTSAGAAYAPHAADALRAMAAARAAVAAARAARADPPDPPAG